MVPVRTAAARSSMRWRNLFRRPAADAAESDGAFAAVGAVQLDVALPVGLDA